MRWGLAALGAALVIAATGDARAQGDADVREILRDALREFNDGRFEEARALFRQAHAREPTARTLRGIGMAAFELRDYVDAYAHLAQAIVETERALTSEQRAATEDLLRRTSAFVGRYRFTSNPGGARVAVNLRPPRLDAEGWVLLPIGEHVVTLELRGHREETQSVTVQGGERLELEIGLEPVGRDADGDSAGAGSSRDEAPSSGSSSGSPWLLLGASAVLTVAAVGSGLWFGDRVGEVDVCASVRAPDVCDNRPTLATERDGALGATAVAGAGAAVMLTLAIVSMLGGGADAADGEGEGDVACAPAPASIGAGCFARF